jgi:vancomycin resistance protein VanJ
MRWRRRQPEDEVGQAPPSPDRRAPPATTRGWPKWAADALGVLYPVSLLVVWLALRFSHDTWWPLLVALYAPPFGWLFPAPIVLGVLWRWGNRRLCILSLAAVAFAVFALLGLGLGLGRDGRAARDPRAIRLVSYNIQLGERGIPGVVAQVIKLAPNVVLLQEAQANHGAELRQAFEGWHIDHRDQFFLASRFPILEVRQPPPLHYLAGEGGGHREGDGGAHFMAYTLATDIGPVDVFSVHTTSPREGLESMRGRGFLYELRHGHVLFGHDAGRLLFNAYRRRRQIYAVAAAARSSNRPVIVAGDFNMPAMSRVPRDSLTDLDDAFMRAGRGFGFTYPSRLPFLRIDRIFTGHGLRAVDFRVGDTRASDHLCVSAVITPQVGAAP